MTTYSLLGTGARVTLIASWPGTMCDLASKVTTVEDRLIGEDLAESLTTLSEAAWYAATWLDTWPQTHQHLTDLIAWLREPVLGERDPRLDLADCRHHDAASSYDYDQTARFYLPPRLRALSHAQRLAVADEVAADCAAMLEALRVAPTGADLAPEARGWQFGEVTRRRFYGQAVYLPDGAANWAATLFDAGGVLQTMWAARGHLLRVEQLVAAGLAAGGRGSVSDDPLVAHCVLPQGDDVDRIIYAGPTGRPHLNGHLPMRVRDRLSRPAQDGPETTSEVDPYDTDALVNHLGDWVTAVPMRT
ncbi:hypothetical protein [Jannaschia sp. R86511]|uniref:hypothetical protein n=1 Tax=Jannaschia sp. R86511 TaxID=3093853 RepID=UPI0036D369AB